MDRKSFFNGLINGKKDIIKEIIDIMNNNSIEYCVIGGLAVNAYVEPVVSLDMDIVIAAKGIEKLITSVKDKFTINKFEHSINLQTRDSDIRIQIQTDVRYQDFLKNALIRDVMDYKMNVASLADILKGKVWAYSDTQRRGSKRQKDLADIMRILESYPELKSKLPENLADEINK